MQGISAVLSSCFLIFLALVTLVAYLIAKRAGLFRLPPEAPVPSLSFWPSAGIFIGYLGLTFVVLPLIFVSISLVMTGHPLAWIKNLSARSKLALALGQLLLIFAFVCFYLRMIDRKFVRFLFWGDESRPTARFFWKNLGIGALTWLVSYPSMIFMSLFAGLISLGIWGKRGVEQVAVKQLKITFGDPLLFGVMLVFVIFIVPFMEEVFFRGFLQSYLRRLWGRSWGLVSTAAIFAVVHASPKQGSGNLELILALFVLSLFLGLLKERQKSLWAPIGLHATFNALSALFIVLKSRS